jgi:hypothetical protein
MASDYRIISLLQYIFCLKVMQVKVYVMASWQKINVVLY